MSLDIIVDHTTGALSFKLTLANREYREVSKWLGVSAVNTATDREAIARAMLNELHGSRAPLEEVVRVCNVLKEATKRCGG